MWMSPQNGLSAYHVEYSPHRECRPAPASQPEISPENRQASHRLAGAERVSRAPSRSSSKVTRHVLRVQAVAVQTMQHTLASLQTWLVYGYGGQFLLRHQLS